VLLKNPFPGIGPFIELIELLLSIERKAFPIGKAFFIECLKKTYYGNYPDKRNKH